MKEFNLEEVKQGKPVRTRNGEKVRIICFDRRNESYPIVALVGEGEGVTLYTNKGRYDKDRKSESGMDLVMAPNCRWANVYKHNINGSILTGRITYNRKEIAERMLDLPCDVYTKITTIPIEWE